MDEVTDQASSSKEKAEDINKVESETWLDATLTLRNDPEFSDPKLDLKEMPELRMSSAEDDSDDNATDDYKKTEKEDEGKKKRIGTKVAKTGIRRNVRASKSSKIPSLRSRTPDSGQTAGVAKMKASVSPKLAPSPEKPGIVSDSVDKVSVYEMLIKMLERNEDKKGLSVPMLKKLFREKHPEKDWDRLRPYLKRAIEKGEAEGTIVRPKSCADSKGLQGSFLLKRTPAETLKKESISSDRTLANPSEGTSTNPRTAKSPKDAPAGKESVAPAPAKALGKVTPPKRNRVAKTAAGTRGRRGRGASSVSRNPEEVLPEKPRKRRELRDRNK